MTCVGIHARLDDLQGDPAADGLLLLGHVDDAHAPFADLLQQLVGADDVPGPSVMWRGAGMSSVGPASGGGEASEVSPKSGGGDSGRGVGIHCRVS